MGPEVPVKANRGRILLVNKDDKGQDEGDATGGRTLDVPCRLHSASLHRGGSRPLRRVAQFFAGQDDSGTEGAAASDPVWGGGAVEGGPANVAPGLATTLPSAGLDQAPNPIGLFGADPRSSRAARPEMRNLKSIRAIERRSRRRTKMIPRFPTARSCLTLLWASLVSEAMARRTMT